MAPDEPESEDILGRAAAATGGADVDRPVVWLHGEYDISTMADLADRLARAIALGDADLVVDLSGVRFMDARSVGVLVQAQQVLRLRSRSLVLRSPSAIARRVIDACGLAGALGVVPSASTPGAASAGALGTWVAVPAAARADAPADAPGVEAEPKAPAADVQANERSTNVGGPGGQSRDR